MLFLSLCACGSAQMGSLLGKLGEPYCQVVRGQMLSEEVNLLNLILPQVYARRQAMWSCEADLLIWKDACRQPLI